ncbi:hypothetical protein RB594_006720 [Gaeumannomyces avenae]
MDTSVFETPASEASRLRTGTLRRSCEACRALKARCILDTSAPQRPSCCQRCSSHGLDCVFEEALARPKRARHATRTRVKDVEDKIDNLIALIAARNAAAEIPKLLVDVLPLNPPICEDVAVPPLPEHLPVNMIFPDSVFGCSRAASVEPVSSTHDVFSKGIISLAVGESLLAAFKDRDLSMPFVVLAPHMSFEYLRRERPCMLLAIMAVTEVDDPLQERLIDEFRQFVAQNVIVAGHKSIDIIQGITMFCVWHHHASRPHIHQMYQMSQVAATMALELGLPALSQIHEMNSQQRSGRESNPQFWDDLERIRAYLHCYLISNCISRAMKKPNPLKHSKRIDEASKLVASLKKAPSDDALLHFIRLQQFIEEVETVFRYCDPDGMDQMDGWKIHSMSKVFEQKLSLLKDSTPPELLDNPFVKMTFIYMPIYITEISLNTPPGHDRKGVACCDWCVSTYRAELIVSCVRACHVFLNEFIAFPDHIIKMFNLGDVGRHLYAIMILGRVNMRQGMGSLDLAFRSELTNIGPYLIASENKMASLLTYLPDGSVKQDSFWQLRELFASASSMLATWKAEPAAFQPPEKECEFSLRLDLLMDPVRAEEGCEFSRQAQQQVPGQNPITPESLSNWGGDHDLILANLNSMSPPTNWF